ncbi:MAG: M23 family metallopeptidase, partial [Chitinivibrionales bacterium]|nr:M23 family metallopeptidase [Chitinivibrionales bacterium]
WDINFITDPQIGDSFVMIFETMYCDGRFIDFGSILAAKYVNQTKSYYAFGIRDTFAQMHYFDINGRPLKKQFLRSPVRLSKLTSEFSLRRRHPIYGVIRPHLGIDLAAPVGTPVYAAADGIINSIGRVQGYGLQIRLNHGTSVETYYGHLHDIAPGITKEQTIKQGQLIGFVGSTGDATGPHLDYRIKLNGEFCNPEMLKSGVVEDYIINSENTAVFEQTKQTYLALIDNRLNRSGCYVLEITVPQIDSTILAKTSFPPIPHS